MISFFTIASQDQSLYYLSQMFGTVGTVLVPANGNTTFNLMSVMFKSLNTTALILGAILVTQTTVMGLIKTAAEGEFLGKQWSSIWVPVRMVMGIASLFPTAAGYSVLQIILMWVILQGVGAADSLWTVVLNYVNAFGSPYSTVTLPTTIDVSSNIKNLFADLSCEESLRGDPSGGSPLPIQYSDINSNSGQHYYYYCADPANASSNFCTNSTLGANIANASGVTGSGNSSQAVNANALSSSVNGNGACSSNGGNNTITCLFGPPVSPTQGACGSMTFGDVSKVCPGGSDINSILQCAGYQSQQTALAYVIDVLYNTALDLVKLDQLYLEFYIPNTPTNADRTIPSFISNYCQSNNINPQNCCSYTGQQSGTQCVNSFPAASSDDNSSASDAVLQNIMWPCYIEAVVSGDTSGGSTCIKGSPGNVDFIGASVTYYKNAINGGIAKAMMAYLSNASNLSGTWASAQKTGWILAGSYYYKIAQANSNTSKLALPVFSVAAPVMSNSPVNGYRTNITASATLIQQIDAQSQDPNSAAATNPQLSTVSSGMNSVASGIWDMFSSALTGGSGGVSNPLTAMAQLGENLMITAQVLYATTLATMSIILALSAAGSVMVLGSGEAESSVLEVAKFAFGSLYAIIMAFMGWCVTFGGLLGVYTPLVPYIIFTSGAIGWFIAVIEAMVAAPFVALGILSPSGQHEILGKAEPGLMILFSTFLRPTLMIIGMMAAMIMAPIVITMINSGFSSVMTSIVGDTPGLLELIVFISAYASLVLTSLNKCFALIHIIPDRALTWIGGHAGSAGSDAGEALGAVKSATSAAAEGAGSSAKGGMDSMGSASAAAQKGTKDDKAAKDSAQMASGRHQELMGDKQSQQGTPGFGGPQSGPKREDGSF
jgi:conjugal transfer/type IV secretion protein DotA/TraY